MVHVCWGLSVLESFMLILSDLRSSWDCVSPHVSVRTRAAQHSNNLNRKLINHRNQVSTRSISFLFRALVTCDDCPQWSCVTKAVSLEGWWISWGNTNTKWGRTRGATYLWRRHGEPFLVSKTELSHPPRQQYNLGPGITKQIYSNTISKGGNQTKR
jgi:hypothetical protein